MMKPILFNTEMVRAILDGRKTVTRRVVKPQPVGKLAYCMAGYKHGTWCYPSDDVWKDWGAAYKRDTPIPENERFRHWTPPCHTDDVLWVRETWALIPDDGYKYRYCFRANEENIPIERWYPSIHMPRESARIFLRVTDVRVERLQEIDEDGAIAEGLYKGWRLTQSSSLAETARQAFVWLWQHLTRKAPDEQKWSANPWVWVIDFERCKKPKET